MSEPPDNRSNGSGDGTEGKPPASNVVAFPGAKERGGVDGSGPPPTEGDARKRERVRKTPDSLQWAMEQIAANRPIATIADELGITRQALWEWQRSPEGQIALAEIRLERAELFKNARKSARALINEALPVAAETLLRNCDDPDPHASSRAAAEILDRGGVPRTEVVETHSPLDGLDLTKLDSAELELLEELLAKARPA